MANIVRVLTNIDKSGGEIHHKICNSFDINYLKYGDMAQKLLHKL
jgi:hypothetical protein